MFAILAVFGVLFIAPFALLGVVLASVGFILKMVVRVIALPFMLIGISVKLVVFILLTVVASALMLPLLMGAVFFLGTALFAVWAVLAVMTALVKPKSTSLVKI